MATKLPIVEIIWRDAYGDAEWHHWDDEEFKVIVNTIGYVVAEDKEYLYLASSFAEKTKKVANTINIPKGCIVSTKYFRGGKK